MNFMNRDSSQVGDSANESLQCQSKPPHSILVVDDEIFARQWLAEALVQHGYHVNELGDGAAAWEALQDKTYDLVITDNSMPKLTGVGMVKLLRGQDTSLPVIMVSAAVPTEELERHLGLGINAFLLKPYAIGEMLSTVQKVLSGPQWTAAGTTPFLSNLHDKQPSA
jgi:DNA-binding response OmpR family regulator